MTGDGILHRGWIVLILPCGTFHTVGYERLRKGGIDRIVLFVFPKDEKDLQGVRKTNFSKSHVINHQFFRGV